MSTESAQSGSDSQHSQPTDANESMSQSSDSPVDDEGSADTQPQLDKQSSLQDLLEAQRRQLAQVEEDSEEVKRVIAELLAANVPDRQVAGELQEVLAGSIGQVHEEHDEVRLSEIIFALWLELIRAVSMFTDADEAATDSVDEAEASSVGQSDDAKDTVDESLFDSDDSGSSSDTEGDEESDDPMRTSVRMFQ